MGIAAGEESARTLKFRADFYTSELVVGKDAYSSGNLVVLPRYGIIYTSFPLCLKRYPT